MDIAEPNGCTATIGENQGYRGLPIRVEAVYCPVAGGEVPQVTSAWKPSPEDIEALANGAVIEVSVQGGQPPIIVSVAAPRTDG